MKKIHLYFRTKPRQDRFVKGDRYVIGLIKKLFTRKKTGGVEKVFINLCKGFDRLNIAYDINLPFKKMPPDEPVVVLGSGRYALGGYNQPNPIIAGIGLMTHPSEWPELCDEYPVAKYLQHSDWAMNVYIPYYGIEKCGLWPAGIDTERWLPVKKTTAGFDILIYNKIRWNQQQMDDELKLPVFKKLDELGLTYREITYGQYDEGDYFNLLQQCRAMVFLCEHESQGLACCEALSANVPVFAWDQGFCLDPNRFRWNDPVIPATSVPFFDGRCGMRFKDMKDFDKSIIAFWEHVKNGDFKPREYILENLTLEKSAQDMLAIISGVYQ